MQGLNNQVSEPTDFLALALNQLRNDQNQSSSTPSTPHTNISDQGTNLKSKDSHKYEFGVTFDYHANRNIKELITNSLNGFLIWLLRSNGPMFEEHIMPYLTKNYQYLRKPNGLPYNAEARRALRGTLKSTPCFDRDNYGKVILKEPQTT